ncbi:hypothetical protein ACFSB1_12575 [Halopseudomonas phragmitis]|uniref:Uncharacterized protein n=1 Tax=Halopseudomonas phragmitis TaxID=1931241 RepID=A0A1V0B0L3_9GAMM|nr:hypothetical protein [Halopseudomonas phragmitis]AQZ93483.1 hypothetical protein BVH74_01295 [Halopseudomonas phragmitis]
MSKVDSLSDGPACEPAKLIIEVVGINHPQGQRLMLSEHGSDQPAAISEQASTEVLEDEVFSSTLHLWPWEDASPCDVWLEVDTTEGVTIRLPLAEELGASKRQLDGQENQVAAVVPLALVRSGVRMDDGGVPVVSRPGYLYVFFRGTLWRELEIRQTEQGTFYHDVNLQSWRDSGQQDGRRAATGVALEEIWLPARWKSGYVSDVQVAYSEVQWTAPRIRRLEADAQARGRRCQPVAMRLSGEYFKSMESGSGQVMAAGLLSALLTNNLQGLQAAAEAERQRRRIAGRVFPLAGIAPQRQRDDMFEYQFNEPTGYLLDLEGQYPLDKMEHAEQMLDAFLHQQRFPRGELETDALNICMKRHVLALQETDAEAEEQEQEHQQQCQQVVAAEQSWQNLERSPDMLAQVRDRKICGILVEDALYRMRQLKDRLTAIQTQINLSAQIAGQQEHFSSALLVDNYILSSRLGRGSNPLRRYAEALDGQGVRKVRRALAQPLKRNISECHEQIRTVLAECLDDTCYQETLADAFSQDDIQYTCTFALAGQALLATASVLRDPLKIMPTPQVGPADRFMVRFQREDHPLRAMLLPRTTLESCMQAYELPDGEEHNEGDGHFRCRLLARLEEMELPEPSNLMLLEARALVAAAEGDMMETVMTAGLSKSVNLALTVASNVQSALIQAEARLHELGLDIRHYEALDADLQASRSALSEQSRVLKISAFQLDGTDLGRAIAPGTLGGLRIYRTGNVNERDLLIVPQQVMGAQATGGTQMSGHVFGDGDRLVASTNSTAATDAGLAGTKQAPVALWVVAEGTPTAALFRNTYDLFNQTAAAEERALAAAAESDQLERTSKARRRALRVLNHPLLPAFLVGVEVYNLAALINTASQVERVRGRARVASGVLATFYDLVLASQILAERIASDTAAMQRVTGALNKPLFRNPLAKTSKRFAFQVSGRMLLGAVGAVAVVGIGLWDAMDAFNHSDSSGWGHLIAAGGGMVMLVSAFMAGPAAGATGMAAFIGPAGWALMVGIGLVVAGAFIADWLRDAPIEQWLKLGPFGAEEIDGFLWMKGEKPEHLQNKHEAFYRLVGLLAGIRIEIGINPEQARALREQPYLGEESHYYAMRRANKLIRIRSSIPGLFGASDASFMRVGVSMTETVSTTSLEGVTSVTTHPVHGKQFELDTRSLATDLSCMNVPSFVVHQELTPEGLDIYLEEPPLPRQSRLQQAVSMSQTLAIGWAVRVQLSAQGTDQRHWVFPAPEPKDPLQYDSSRHGRINYIRTGQAFWADQVSDLVEQT